MSIIGGGNYDTCPTCGHEKDMYPTADRYAHLKEVKKEIIFPNREEIEEAFEKLWVEMPAQRKGPAAVFLAAAGYVIAITKRKNR